jgi:hypothetical protein
MAVRESFSIPGAYEKAGIILESDATWEDESWWKGSIERVIKLV